ncbi:uncharacterized protein VP01_544g11, partial [Puccinia sorghi]
DQLFQIIIFIIRRGQFKTSHHHDGTVENSANALDRLFDSQFIEGDMSKSINQFRTSFRRVVEVSAQFDKTSLEAVANLIPSSPISKQNYVGRLRLKFNWLNRLRH